MPLIDLISEIEAKIYVLDCLPNLASDSWERWGIENEQALKDRILVAVQALREKQPEVPILLVDHAGYTQALVSDKRAKKSAKSMHSSSKYFIN